MSQMYLPWKLESDGVYTRARVGNHICVYMIDRDSMTGQWGWPSRRYNTLQEAMNEADRLLKLDGIILLTEEQALLI